MEEPVCFLGFATYSCRCTCDALCEATWSNVVAKEVHEFGM